MGNTKVEVKINNMEYTIVSNEPEEYVQRVALLVNKKISEVKGSDSQLSTAMLAILAAMNLADEYIKSDMTVDNLRGEMGTYMDEAQKKGEELESKKLEVETLKEDLHKLEIELAKRDTELENLRSSHSAQRQTTSSAYSQRGYTQNRTSAPVSGQTSFDSATSNVSDSTSASSSTVQYPRTTSAADRYRNK